jgi:hypothetical protein
MVPPRTAPCYPCRRGRGLLRRGRCVYPIHGPVSNSTLIEGPFCETLTKYIRIFIYFFFDFQKMNGRTKNFGKRAPLAAGTRSMPVAPCATAAGSYRRAT